MRLLLLTLLAAIAFPAAARADDAIIVKRAPGLDQAERAAVRADAGVTLDEPLTLPDTEVVVAEPGERDAALDALNANPDVLYAEPDLPVAPATADPRFDNQWGLLNTGQTVGTIGTPDADIDAPEAWLKSRGAGTIVAVVDTGAELTHADLAGQWTGNPGERGGGRETNGVDDDHNGFVDDWQGWDFVHSDNSQETEGNFHSTHVSGTIAALTDNGVGVAGVAPLAKVLPVKIFGAPGSTASSSVIAQAFDYAGDLGVDVVNASLGGFGMSQTVTRRDHRAPEHALRGLGGQRRRRRRQLHALQLAGVEPRLRGVERQPRPALELLERQRERGRPVRPGLVRALDDDQRRLHLRQRDLDGRPARQRRRRAARRGRADRDGRAAEGRAAGLGRREGGVQRARADRWAVECGVGAERAGGRGRADARLRLPRRPHPPTPPRATPTPAPPSPTATPTPPPVATPGAHARPDRRPARAPATVKALKITGAVTAKRPAKVTYTLSAGATVTIAIRCSAPKACASTAPARASRTEKAGTRSFDLTRKQGGKVLPAGKYTLTLSTSRSSRSATFTVK